jgi:rhodanese-related sulfurtransferase
VRDERAAVGAWIVDTLILDVREPQEFDAEHVDGAVNVPLSGFDRQGPALVRALGRPVLLMCRSGKRAAMAEHALRQAGVTDGFTVYEGGITQWKAQGHAVVAAAGSAAGKTIPIMRQVQMIAGALVVVSLLLAWQVNPLFAWLAAMVGAGLTLAGATGFCGLALMLAKAPWNQAPKPVAPAPATACQSGCKCGVTRT